MSRQTAPLSPNNNQITQTDHSMSVIFFPGWTNKICWLNFAFCFSLYYKTYFLPFSNEIVTKSFKCFLFLHLWLKHIVNRHMCTAGKSGNVSNFKCSSAMSWSFLPSFASKGRFQVFQQLWVYLCWVRKRQSNRWGLLRAKLNQSINLLLKVTEDHPLD